MFLFQCLSYVLLDLDDTDESRIQTVRRKTAKYLRKAEEVQEKYLSNIVGNTALASVSVNNSKSLVRAFVYGLAKAE